MNVRDTQELRAMVLHYGLEHTLMSVASVVATQARMYETLKEDERQRMWMNKREAVVEAIKRVRMIERGE